MIFPLCILAIGAISGGYLFYNLVYDNNFWIESIYTKSDINYVEEAHHVEKVFKLFPIFLVVLASIIVFFSYRYIKNLSNLLNNNFKLIIKLLKNKWYFDDIYGFLFVRKMLQFCRYLWSNVDVAIIDSKGPIGIANNVWKAASYCRQAQNGKVFSYAIVMFAGIVVFVSLIFFN